MSRSVELFAGSLYDANLGQQYRMREIQPSFDSCANFVEEYARVLSDTGFRRGARNIKVTNPFTGNAVQYDNKSAATAYVECMNIINEIHSRVNTRTRRQNSPVNNYQTTQNAVNALRMNTLRINDSQARVNTQIPVVIHREVSRSNKRQTRAIHAPEDEVKSKCLQLLKMTYLNESETKKVKQMLKKGDFKQRINGMLGICSYYQQKSCESTRLQQIRDECKKTLIQKPNHKYHIKLDTEWYFAEMFNKAKHNRSKMFDELFMNNEFAYKVSARGKNGQGIGVTRNFIQQCLDEISNNPKSDDPFQQVKFFKPVSSKSGVCVLNHDLDIAKLRQLNFDVTSISEIPMIYNLIGRLFAYSFCHGVPIPTCLSKTIIGHILFSNIPKDMYTLNLLLEEDESAVTSYIYMMKNNDVFELDDPDLIPDFNEKEDAIYNASENKLSADNFFKFLYMKSLNLFENKFANNYTLSKANLDAFLDGFFILNKLRELKVTTKEFETMFCSIDYNYKDICNWIDRYTSDENTTVLKYYSSDLNGAEQVFRWLEEIFADKGVSFPDDKEDMVLSKMDRMIVTDENMNGRISARKQACFTFFVIKLIHFWTGFKKLYTEHKSLKVAFKQNTKIDNVILTAQTCDSLLYLPTPVASKEVLFKGMIESVFGVETGIGLV